MNDQLNSSKGFLKDKLGGYQVDPPEKVWDSISTLLGGRSRKGMIIIVLSIAATIALAVTLGINYFGPEPNEAGVAETGIDEVGRETLEEKVTRTMEELATDEITREEIVTEELAVNVDTEEAAREFSSLEVAAIGNFPQEQLGKMDSIEQLGKMDNTLQSDEMTDTKPSVDMTDEMTDMDTASIEDSPAPVLDTGDELPTDPVPDLEMNWKKDPRWIIGAALSPLYSFRDAEATAMKGAAEHESGMISYAAGVHVGYRTASRLTIESGLFFNKMGIAIGASGIRFFNQSYDRSFDFAPLGAEASSSNVVAISNSVGNIVSKSGDIYVNSYKLNASYETNALADNASGEIYAEGIKQHLDYLEVPFNLRYTVVDRDLELQLVGGLSTNLLVNNYVTMETATGPTEIGYLTNIRNVNYSGNAGLGLIYHIQKQFSLHLEPRFRYFLNSVNDGTLPSTRPYTFAIFTGLSYTF